jgi:hypothetical protein
MQFLLGSEVSFMYYSIYNDLYTLTVTENILFMFMLRVFIALVVSC